jgi:hypothetical protein
VRGELRGWVRAGEGLGVGEGGGGVGGGGGRGSPRMFDMRKIGGCVPPVFQDIHTSKYVLSLSPGFGSHVSGRHIRLERKYV